MLKTVSRQPPVWRIWFDVSISLLQTNVTDYVTLNLHINGVPYTVLSAYSGHLHVVTVGNGIFLAKFLDKKCYAIMADRKKVFTMQGVGIPESAVGQGGKAGPQPSSSSDRTLIANSSKSLMNQRCAACSRFTKSVNKRKKRVESVDEANAFSFCFGKSIVLDDVLCWNCRIIACKNGQLNDGSRFPDNEETFSESEDFSESSDKDPEFKARIKSKVSTGVEHIRIQIQRTVATHKYCAHTILC